MTSFREEVGNRTAALIYCLLINWMCTALCDLKKYLKRTILQTIPKSEYSGVTNWSILPQYFERFDKTDCEFNLASVGGKSKAYVSIICCYLC